MKKHQLHKTMLNYAENDVENYTADSFSLCQHGISFKDLLLFNYWAGLFDNKEDILELI